MVNVVTSTHDMNRWHNDIVPAIQRADWLTEPLAESGVLTYDFIGARIAPIAVGLGQKRERPSRSSEGEPEVHIKAAVDTDYLLNPPIEHFNPHYDIRKQVRDKLEDKLKNGKKPDVTVVPGYVFPDIGGGVLLLDGVLFDSDCTPEKVEPAAEALSKAFSIGLIAVGDEVLIRNEFSPEAPDVSVPSVIRTALTPDRKGNFQPRAHNFRQAADFVRSIQ